MKKHSTAILQSNRLHPIHARIGFSPEEKRLIRDYQERSPGSRWSWYLVYLVPMLLFAGYGVFKLDVLAVMVAFAALFFFTTWMIYGGIRSTEQLKIIFEKYHAYIARVESEKTTDAYERKSDDITHGYPEDPHSERD